MKKPNISKYAGSKSGIAEKHTIDTSKMESRDMPSDPSTLNIVSVTKDVEQRVQPLLDPSATLSLEDIVKDFIDKKASYATSFRFPKELLDELEVELFQLKRTSSVKLSKTEFIVFGLAFVLADLKKNREHSLIYKYLIKKSV